MIAQGPELHVRPPADLWNPTGLAAIQDNDAAELDAIGQQVIARLGVNSPTYRALVTQEGHARQHLRDQAPYAGEVEEVAASCQRWLPPG